jgi:inner membrane protein
VVPVAGGRAAGHRGARPPMRWRRAWPALALLAVLALDAVKAARAWPIPVVGVLDEPAHLLTAWLLLAAVPPLAARLPFRWVLVGAVAVDLDHLPLYAFGGPVAEPDGRPVTHSALAVLLLLAAARLRPRHTDLLLGLATGLVLHLVRDVAGGPGIPLLWPLADAGLRLPYAVYATVLVVAAGVATVRSSPARGNRGDPPRT